MTTYIYTRLERIEILLAMVRMAWRKVTVREHYASRFGVSLHARIGRDY
jgi:hypothetical protein